MFKFRQSGKPRIVMTGGKVIAEFENGTAVVDKEAADVLTALGYEAETEAQADGGNAVTEAPAENTGNKRSGRGKSA